jgi:metal-responsive CopG/Arc/MetJ family transcriptional regulator
VVKKYHTDLPEELSKEFDEIVEAYYLKDAEAVRDAIRRMVFDFRCNRGKNESDESEEKR